MRFKLAMWVLVLMICVPIGLAFWLLFEREDRADVVVIGAGASGMSAAIEADLAGNNVILLEKMPYVGGNTVRATAGMNAVLTKAQIAAGIEDSEDLFMADVLESGHAMNAPLMIERMINESAAAVEWLEMLGADLSDVGILAGHSHARTHRPSGGQPIGNEIVRTLKRAIDESGVTLRLEHKATRILKDNQGRIRGVEVVDRSGKTYVIQAKKVIIATGGFGGSPETFVYYNQKLKGYHTTNSPSATGDFIDLVQGLNVQLVDMSYIQTHPTVSPEYGMLITEAIRGNGGILVNNQGMRFANEMKNRDFLSEDLLAQDDREVYLIFNETIRTSLAASDDYIDMKIIQMSETIEGLAREIRLDPLVLEETITRYNQFVEEGVDRDHGRRSLKQLLDEGPFFAVRVVPGVHYCMGGILIDQDARVIDVNNQPIEGLYASGEATGGIHGLNRLGGNSLLDAIVFGRIAGRNVSSD